MKRAFTLIELLVVIAIIALLIGIMIPAISKIKEEPVPGPVITDEQREAIEIVESLIYVRDSATGLVFAIYNKDEYRNEGYGYMTVVPPSHIDRIEHLIVETSPVLQEEGEH